MDALPTVPGGYRTILADPPWSFRDRGSRIAPDQVVAGALRHYATMKLGDICRLPVENVAAPDALLFLWTTSAHLLSGAALKVCEAWGFEPKTTVVWVKCRTDLPCRCSGGCARCGGVKTYPRLQIGMGHYTRAAHELMIVARRGKGAVLRHDVPSVLLAQRARHSAKPPESYELIEKLSPGPRLELFARVRFPGWDAWGDQAPTATPEPAMLEAA